MKTRESGMPDEGLWSTFFKAEEILEKLGLTTTCRSVVDFGCGYGTFTIPAARMVRGTVYALDIEPDMVALTAAKARAAGLKNVELVNATSSPLAPGFPTPAWTTPCSSTSFTRRSHWCCSARLGAYSLHKESWR